MEQQPYSFMLGDLWDQALAYNNLPTGSPCRFGACSYSNSCKIFTISDFWAKCMFSSHVTPKSLKLEAYSQSKAMTVSSLTLWGLCFLLSLPRHSHFPFSLASNSSLVQFSHSVMSDSLLHHKLQHARPPCPSPTPGVHLSLSPCYSECAPWSQNIGIIWKMISSFHYKCKTYRIIISILTRPLVREALL